jgi:hypothetical protein
MRLLLRRIYYFLFSPFLTQLRKQSDLMLLAQTKALQASHPNPLNKFGRKVFSQTDEDGITLEIIRRIGLGKGSTYGEFGVGDGLENNTLVLAALGFRGFWVGGEELAFKAPATSKFTYIKAWITRENVLDLTREGMAYLGTSALDVVSIDLDGNDLYFVEALLDGNIRPKLFIAEYNAKFPPPIEFQIAYDANHVWQHDDYFGASLASFNTVFLRFGYRLICCNAHTGSNAFFVDADCADMFPEVPAEIEKIYVEPRYFLYNEWGHRGSPRTVESILRG